MRVAEYLSIAAALGLSRRDAMLMEISVVCEMATIRSKANAEKKKGVS